MGDESAGLAGLPERLGDFRLLERLGAGGMGVVYLARQESLQRDVALKLIRPEHLGFTEARERFRREVEAAAKLSHHGIVPVYSVGEEHGLPYFAMEIVEGASLADVIDHLRGSRPSALDGADLRAALLAQSRRLGGASSSTAYDALFTGTWVQACCRIALQVAEALQHAHERGVLHRDVKPSNVLLTPSGRARLLDFGLASTSEASRITQSGAQIGSLPYMPPECLSRGTYAADARSDVYSLGVSLFEMLALRLPFEGPMVQDLVNAISSGEHPRLRDQNPSVPWDAAVVCATAMERDPARRYPSAEALARDLRNLLELRPIEARAPSRVLRARRWVQRHPTATVAGALGFLLFVVAPSVALWRIRAERDAALRDLQAKESMFAFVLDLFRAADPLRENMADVTVHELLEIGTQRVRTELRDAPEVRARLLIDLGTIQARIGRPRDAIELLWEGLALWRELESEGEIFNAQREIALQLMKVGELEEAQRMLVEVQAGVLRRHDPGDEAMLIDLQGDLAAAMILHGRLDEGERILTELASRPDWESRGASKRSMWLTNMGQICRQRGDTARAAELHGQALELARETFGDVHSEVARSLQNLAVLHSEGGRPEQAIELLLEARDIQAKLGAGESIEQARLAFNLAQALAKAGRLEESTAEFRRSLEICRRLSGDSAQTARAAMGYGNALVKTDRAAEAEPILREALDLSRRYIQSEGMHALEPPLVLARCLVALERGDEAIPLYEEVLRHVGEPGVGLERAARYEGEVGELLRSLGREEEAAAHLDRQRELARQAGVQ